MLSSASTEYILFAALDTVACRWVMLLLTGPQRTPNVLVSHMLLTDLLFQMIGLSVIDFISYIFLRPDVHCPRPPNPRVDSMYRISNILTFPNHLQT